MADMTKYAISVCLRKGAWRLLLCAAVSVSIVVTAEAQQFSADIVTRRDDVAKVTGRLSVRDGKVRIETAEHPDGFFLVDASAAKPSAYFVRPAAHIYMEARQSSRLTRLFVPVDPDAPCRQWQAMAQLAGVGGEGESHCKRSGEETIDGHAAIVFQVVTGAGQGYAGSIDRVRKFPLRITTADGVLIALEKIEDEPQPASSFELPPGVRKFSPEALIERIKRSDVWVSRLADAPVSPGPPTR